MLLKRQSEKVDVLQKVPIFQGLSARHLRLIAREAEELQGPAGKNVLRGCSSVHRTGMNMSSPVGGSRKRRWHCKPCATIDPVGKSGESALRSMPWLIDSESRP